MDLTETNRKSSAAYNFDIFLECVRTASVEKVRNMIRENREFLTMKNSSGDSGLVTSHICVRLARMADFKTK